MDPLCDTPYHNFNLPQSTPPPPALLCLGLLLEKHAMLQGNRFKNLLPPESTQEKAQHSGDGDKL